MSKPAESEAPRLLALLALANLALTRPILGHAEANPHYFPPYGIDGLDLLVITLVLTLLPGMLLWLPGHLMPALQRVALALVGGALGIQLASGVGLALSGKGIAGLAGAAAAATLARLPGRSGVRLGLLCLALAPGLHFLLFSPVTPLVVGGGGSVAEVPRATRPASVVFVVFDELPLYLLVDEDGALDAATFPNFARLATISTWFRQGTAVHTWTKAALPAILTGRHPKANLLPVASQFPENLFALLAGSLRMRVFEGGTSLLPAGAGVAQRAQNRGARLRAVLQDAWTLAPLVLSGRDEGPELVRAAQKLALFDGREWFDHSRSPETAFEDFLESFDGEGPPGLHFLHSLVPHAPWRYLPDGQSYHHVYDPNALTMRLVPMDDGNSVQLLRWGQDEWLVRHTYQRILLQARYVDHLLGQLLDRLEAEGILEEALLVVTADHGLAMAPQALLRELSPLPVEARAAPVAGPELDLLPVPFFVKRPGQRAGSISERNVSHVDLVPTVAAELGLALPWEVDGRSVFEDGAPPPTKRAADVDFQPHILPPRLAGIGERSRLRRAWFASSEGPGWTHRLLPHGDLVGAEAPTTSRVMPVEVTLRKPDAPRRRYLAGEVRGGPVATRGIFLALVFDGRILAVTRTAAFDGERALVGFFPEEGLPGTADLQVLVLGESEGPARPARVDWR